MIQKPPPYRGLVYADLIHSRESSAKLVKEQSQTVYAQIDHAKTASVMISQHNLEGKKKGELHWTLFVSNTKNYFMKNIKINLNPKEKWLKLSIIINHMSCNYE